MSWTFTPVRCLVSGPSMTLKMSMLICTYIEGLLTLECTIHFSPWVCSLMMLTSLPSWRKQLPQFCGQSASICIMHANPHCRILCLWQVKLTSRTSLPPGIRYLYGTPEKEPNAPPAHDPRGSLQNSGTVTWLPGLGQLLQVQKIESKTQT